MHRASLATKNNDTHFGFEVADLLLLGFMLTLACVKQLLGVGQLLGHKLVLAQVNARIAALQLLAPLLPPGCRRPCLTSSNGGA